MATRQRRHLQFSAFELVLVAASFVVTVTAVFFLGLYVGKKNASYHAPAEERVARIPVDDFTKYKRPAPIEKPEKKAPPAEEPVTEHAAALKPATEPGAVAKSPATEPAVAAKPSAEPLKSPPAPAAVATATAATAPADATAAAKAKADADAAAAKAKEAAAAKEKEKEKAKEEAAKETGRGYTVQILSTRKQAEADALVKKLKSSGYAAYIKKIGEGEAWYRVRVGSYSGFNEAKGMADKCRRDLGLGQAFVSTE